MKSNHQGGSPRHFHLMGIGGIGVSALAQILHQDGHHVSGCDLSASALTERLQHQGIQVFLGHHPSHLQGVDVLVASTAIRQDEPEMQIAAQKGIPVYRRVQLLGEVLGQGYSLGITGSHGKTTTSAMLATILLEAQTDPTIVLGAELDQLGGNARYGAGPYRLAEIDESDPWFQHLKLDIAVVLNLEADHVGHPNDPRPNYHRDFAALQHAVANFAKGAQKVIYNLEWPGLHELVPNNKALSFGLGQGDCHATNLQLLPLGSRFEVFWKGHNQGLIELAVPGKHNVANALAATAVALELGLPFVAIQNALAQFGGAKRRFERLGEVRGAWVVDDYAHNPTKVKALLEAACNTGKRVRAVFQPHRYLRTQQSWEGYAQALRSADESVVLDIYGAGEEPIAGVSGAMIANKLIDEGYPARYLGWDEAIAYLRQSLRPNDLILTIGAGDVWKIGQALLKEEAPA